MKSRLSHLRSISLIAAFLSVSIMLISCENKIRVLPKSDLLTLPSQTVKSFETVLYDSGRIQMKMYSPLVERYDKVGPPYSEFRSGIKVDLYNGQENPVAWVTSKYAKYTNADNLWELRDSVVVINENNERLETEVLFWNQEKDLIYTDRFVKMTSENQIMQGIGFESDSHLNKQKIKKPTAIITLPEEN
jgi:LPS export ABC transporter protein LptC